MHASLTRTASALAVAALVSASVALSAPAAFAHNYLVSSNPAPDSVITEVPDVFSVTTNEALLDLSGAGNGFAIQVTDAAGLYYGDGCGVVDGGTFSSGATLGEPGTYRFLWQVVSADGHTVSEEFTFTFEPSATATITAGSPAAPVCGVTGVEPEPTEEATAEPEVPDATETAVPISAPVDEASTDPLPLIVGGGIGVLAIIAIIAFAVMGRRLPPSADSTDGVESKDADSDKPDSSENPPRG